MIPFPKQSEEAVAAGVIHVTVGGQPKTLPTLKIGPFEDDWLPAQGAAISALFNDETDRPMSELLKVGINTILDAVVAYDTTGALGGRDHLRKNADHAELRAIAHAIYDRHFGPFLKDAQTILETVRRMSQQMAATSLAQRLQEKSTNGASPAGDETPDKSEEA